VSSQIIPFWGTLFNLADRGIDFVPGLGWANYLAAGKLSYQFSNEDPLIKEKARDFQIILQRRQMAGLATAAFGGALIMLINHLADNGCGGLMGITGGRNLSPGAKDTDPCVPNSLYMGGVRITPLDNLGNAATFWRVMGAINDMMDASKTKAANNKLRGKEKEDDDFDSIDMFQAIGLGILSIFIDRSPYKQERELTEALFGSQGQGSGERIKRFLSRQIGGILSRFIPLNRPINELLEAITNKKITSKTWQDSLMQSLGAPKYIPAIARQLGLDPKLPGTFKRDPTTGGYVPADFFWSPLFPPTKDSELRLNLADKGVGIMAPQTANLAKGGVDLSAKDKTQFMDVWASLLGTKIQSRRKELLSKDAETTDKLIKELNKEAKKDAMDRLGISPAKSNTSANTGRGGR
jgi:hypothetical protein